MKAMLLAAGLGNRLRPLTDSVPKPLLEAGGKSLIEHQILRLKAAGVTNVVINVHHLAGKIMDCLGDGGQFGVKIEYSIEAQLLETGGGIKNALSLLGSEPFLVVSADTYLDFDYSDLVKPILADELGVLLMTQNPEHHPQGDFAIDGSGILRSDGDCKTYTGVSVLSPKLVEHISDDRFPLRQVFDPAVAAGQLRGVLHTGYWCDVGTPDRLDQLREKLDSAT